MNKDKLKRISYKLNRLIEKLEKIHKKCPKDSEGNSWEGEQIDDAIHDLNSAKNSIGYIIN